MKPWIFFFLSFLVAERSYSSFAAVTCGSHQIRIYTQTHGYQCVSRYNSAPFPTFDCFGTQPPSPWPQSFPGPIFRPQAAPWWATQGNFYYPNLHYPGAWSFPGVNPGHYPGQGGVHAMKPNVYVNSIHDDKKFEMHFTSDEKPSFLATTPPLERDNSWKGKIVEKDKFVVDRVNYDYLFYDVRLPKEKMQFEHGVCGLKEDIIVWMLKDLAEMTYPSIALQDFEEHWRVKIPDYPYYCLYPQYNKQLDEALPVKFDLEQTTFTRSLYVLIPLKKEPDFSDPLPIPFPFKDPIEFRPSTQITYENMFREWGVAFLDFEAL